MKEIQRISRKDVELLAPVGNWECLRAAVANGADAVFFGVEKFNARARADNFLVEELPEIMAYLHTYGVRGYLTFNILIFEDELVDAGKLVEACLHAGVDAAIVQDLGLVKLIRQISPDFPIHGSTQMTATSTEAVQFLEDFDLEMVVLGRENSLKEIREISQQVETPIEVFVHGALCVSYSGQCLTSEMWGGRSANRGECAQACRLPYDLICDGEELPMGAVKYLLSPKDLAAIDLVPELIEAGVRSFKIEGRLKSPEYVANVVSKYRQAIDRYFAGEKATPSYVERRELQQSFSRGFTHGFLQGTNNKLLLDGTFPKSRGVYLGTVQKVLADSVLVELREPLKRGDGVVFDAGDPTQKEEGGRVYDLRRRGKKIDGEVASGQIEVVLGRNDVNLAKIKAGHKLWKTNDPELDKRLRKTFDHDQPYWQFPLAISVQGAEGTPLSLQVIDMETGAEVTVSSERKLEKAEKRPLTSEYLEEQLARLGGSIFYLERLDNHLQGEVILPVKELNALRREAVDALLELRRQPRVYQWNKQEEVERQQVSRMVLEGTKQQQKKELVPRLTVLCRTLEQVEATCGQEVDYVYADFEFTRDYPQAVEIARTKGKKIALATPRIHKPTENGILRSILKAQPDGILIRNLGALQFYRQEREQVERSIEWIGDFSLNIANHHTVELFLAKGLDWLTPSYDLNIQQMLDLLAASPAEQLEVVIHQHLPMFHTEHCVYCTFLSEGTDYTNCGRPCEEHRVSLRDRVGMSHPVRVDVGCRNTVYNAIEQSGAEYLPQFKQLGVGSYRIEFLEENAEKVEEVISLYSQALRGKISGTSVWRSLKATNQLGVTRGQLVK